MFPDNHTLHPEVRLLEVQTDDLLRMEEMVETLQKGGTHPTIFGGTNKLLLTSYLCLCVPAPQATRIAFQYF